MKHWENPRLSASWQKLGTHRPKPREAEGISNRRFHTSFAPPSTPGSGDWRQRFQNTRCHLLTFNFDRLFEMALLRMFGMDADTQLLYGEDILNSGLHHCMGESMGFKNDRFCFLKLHGSVGMRIHEEYGQPRYYPYLDGAKPGENIELNDDRFLARSANPLPQDRDPEPLIVFPFEKDFVRSGSPNRLAFREYITSVWQQAERVMESASEIWFIGYSFAMMDRTAVIALLTRAKQCQRQAPGRQPDQHCDRPGRPRLGPARRPHPRPGGDRAGGSGLCRRKQSHRVRGR